MNENKVKWGVLGVAGIAVRRVTAVIRRLSSRSRSIGVFTAQALRGYAVSR